ncbi:MAG: TIGR03767 family metallophosphoesterase [Actinomycetota bacterium]|nr:TIGR03767 family metallophosphoesterase [Actinomycetota bacterium]
MDMTRRDFLRATGAAAAGAALPGLWRPRLATALAAELTVADLTTLARTIVKGSALREGSMGKYYRLSEGPGEPHIVREELARRRSAGSQRDLGSARRPLLNFAHFTDIHIIDAESPARVEWFDRYSDDRCSSIPFSSAQRPQETMTLQVLEAMIRQIRSIRVSPLTGSPLASVVCTGDNIDNEQFNELRWFIDAMDGGKNITPDSGASGYEGVQSADWNDPEYWHPDPKVQDKYKQQWGFPDYPGLLDSAMKPFSATGVGIPWYQTFGNHDGLVQGNVQRNAFFEAGATGPAKISGPPPGLQPCDGFQTLRDNPNALLTAPVRVVSPDPARRFVSRMEYIEEMFKTTGTPVGHGFTKANRDAATAYWFTDDHPGFRFIGLDTVNPGGFSEGSIGRAQFRWLEERLLEVSSRVRDSDGKDSSNDKAKEDRLVILFSHHGLRSLDNPNHAPDPLHPDENDEPRVLAPEIEALVHRFPNVIAWVNGHTHNNIIEPRKNKNGGGFWDIGTAAHIDWACQSRLIEVIDNRDGTLSIFCTMVDHAAPVTPSGTDSVLDLASISRELAANDPQYGFEGKGRGEAKDRNVELVIAAPFNVRSMKRQQRRSLVGAPA